MVVGHAAKDGSLSEQEVLDILAQGIPDKQVAGKRILVLTPDHTRTCPLPMMIRGLAKIVAPQTAQLDFMVALGTHPVMDQKAILSLYGLTSESKKRLLPGSRVMAHRWDLPETLKVVGRLEADEIAAITGGRFSEGVDVSINRHVFDYDLILILGPVFPHEVAGFSGGDKYLFPGVAGGDFLHFTHWLGAVVTCWDTIGIKNTPVREALTRAARLVSVPRLCVAMVVRSRTELAGLYVGETLAAWSAAADLSAKIHIVYKDKPFHTVLGTASRMYEEIWVAGKVMYKLEPVVADGGTLIIYGKHINRVSDTWGDLIARIGYHTRDYFLKRMDRFKDIPGGVLAHSTHVRGLGTFESGVEKPRINLVLATSIPEDQCRAINLGYMDPDVVDLDDYRNKEDEGILFVENAGEILHRLKE
ncbi:lactate racemase domain-containing protein [bacterium]|nr:lactate racemase domain-containing protein [bacterium]